jgi:uncharacterized protein
MRKSADRFPEVLFDEASIDVPQDCACPPPVIHSNPPDTDETGAAAAGEGDCACPPAAPLPAMPGLPGGLYQAPADLRFQPLRGGYDAAFAPLVPGGFAVVNASARALLADYRSPRPLEGAAVRLARAGLLLPVGTAPQPAAAPTLTAWLHVTGRCNLRCAYCYVRQKFGSMSAETARAAVEGVFRSAAAGGFGRVQLKYAGGEPTLALDRVLAMHAHAQRLAEARGVAFDAVLLSNAVDLTPRMVRQMLDNGIRLSVSLDGWGEAHDAQRRAAGGQGSFERVHAGLDLLAREGLPPSVTVTITRRSLSGLPAVVEALLARGLAFRLNFYRPPVCSTSGSPGPDPLACTPDEMIAALRAVFEVIRRRPPRFSLLASLLDRCRLDYPHRTPCGYGQSYMVIGSSGALSRCHMQMEQVFGAVTAPDPLRLLRLDAPGLAALDVDNRLECAGCEWRLACAGGCPLVPPGADGRPAHCAVYRALSQEVLRLEGTRLLEAGDRLLEAGDRPL